MVAEPFNNSLYIRVVRFDVKIDSSGLRNGQTFAVVLLLLFLLHIGRLTDLNYPYQW